MLKLSNIRTCNTYTKLGSKQENFTSQVSQRRKKCLILVNPPCPYKFHSSPNLYKNLQSPASSNIFKIFQSLKELEEGEGGAY